VPKDDARIPKDEARKALIREGMGREHIEEILAKLPDPIDVDRDGDFLLRYGITRDHLIDRLGGSP